MATEPLGLRADPGSSTRSANRAGGFDLPVFFVVRTEFLADVRVVGTGDVVVDDVFGATVVEEVGLVVDGGGVVLVAGSGGAVLLGVAASAGAGAGGTIDSTTVFTLSGVPGLGVVAGPAGTVP